MWTIWHGKIVITLHETFRLKNIVYFVPNNEENLGFTCRTISLCGHLEEGEPVLASKGSRTVCMRITCAKCKKNNGKQL